VTDEWNGKFHLSPHENIFNIAIINIHYFHGVLHLWPEPNDYVDKLTKEGVF
jgi:hypothetical protein